MHCPLGGISVGSGLRIYMSWLLTSATTMLFLEGKGSSTVAGKVVYVLTEDSMLGKVKITHMFIEGDHAIHRWFEGSRANATNNN